MTDIRKDIYYLRLSKEDGDVDTGNAPESQSIASQRECIKSFIAENFDKEYRFYEISDDGYSGTNMERPGMTELLNQVRLGNVRTIIVRDLSRFARNYLEAGHFMEFVFPAHNVRFISINDGYDSAALEGATGGFEPAIRNLINQLYSHDISKKIKSTVDMKKMNGEYVYGAVPFGYKKGNIKNTIVVDEIAAEIVKKIFSLACSGLTITQIAKKLNDEKVITPSLYLASSRGKYKAYTLWSYESVRNILTNRIYTGDTIPFKSHVVKIGSNKVKQVPENELIIIENTHEAIVTREQFFDARKVVKPNKRNRLNNSSNLFTSYLVCGCCGKKLQKGKAKNKIWQCTMKRYVADSECENIRINEEKLTEVLLNAIRLQCRLAGAKISAQSEKQKNKQSILYELQRKADSSLRDIERIQGLKMDYYEDFINGRLQKEDFLSVKERLNADEENSHKILSTVQSEIKNITAQTFALTEDTEAVKKIAAQQEISELTPELMKLMVKRIVVYTDNAISIEWNFKSFFESDQSVSA